MNAELRVDGPGGTAVRFTPHPDDTIADYWRVTYLTHATTQLTVTIHRAFGNKQCVVLAIWDDGTRATSFVLDHIGNRERAREVARHLVRQLINEALPSTPDTPQRHQAWLSALRVNQLFAERFPGVESLVPPRGRAN